MTMGYIIVFWVLAGMPSNPHAKPDTREQQVESLEVCWDMAHKTLADALQGRAAANGIQVEAGCAIVPAPSIEH